MGRYGDLALQMAAAATMIVTGRVVVRTWMMMMLRCELCALSSADRTHKSSLGFAVINHFCEIAPIALALLHSQHCEVTDSVVCHTGAPFALFKRYTLRLSDDCRLDDNGSDMISKWKKRFTPIHMDDTHAYFSRTAETERGWFNIKNSTAYAFDVGLCK